MSSLQKALPRAAGLPRAEAPRTERLASVRTKKAPRRIILVVGGAVPPRIAQRLFERGFSLINISEGGDPREAVNDYVPVAVLSLPQKGTDPCAFVRWLRGQECLGFTQVFFLVPHGDASFTSAAMAAGVDDVFPVLGAPLGPDEDEVVERIFTRIARFRALSHLAFVDSLTELPNRRFLEDRLAAEVQRATRKKTRMTLAVLDLDEFKSINDHFGHLAGDRALVAFARALKSGLRAYDVVCRFGGDEFVVLFPDCGAESACAALKQIGARRAWALADLPVPTFSAGLAQFPNDGTSWKDLFQAADRNIRSAKDGGKNLVVGGPPA